MFVKSFSRLCWLHVRSLCIDERIYSQARFLILLGLFSPREHVEGLTVMTSEVVVKTLLRSLLSAGNIGDVKVFKVTS